jgi:3-phenylpropionate/trans-cinnamate dioxygenase ferredoxin reductase subunit
VIVGAGQAGGRTALALRRTGYQGDIELIGEECALPYERPPLSKDFLLGRATQESLRLASQPGWSEQGIELHLGLRVESIDRGSRCVHLRSGGVVTYDVLVLATGVRPRLFPGTVAADAPVCYLRTLTDVQALRALLGPGRRLAIIGAGFIGLEVAAAARELETEVTLVESAARPLMRMLPAAVASWLCRVHAGRGVVMTFGAQVQALDGHGVLLQDGSRIPADGLLVGIGSVPNDDLARTSGLEVSDGIVVDVQGRTSDEAVFAVGDVARHVDPAAGRNERLESWRNAEDDAAAVARAICGLEPAARPVPWFWTDQFGFNIQLAGRPADGMQVVERGRLGDGPYLAHYLDTGVPRGVIGIDCGREVRMAMALIGRGQPVEQQDLPSPRIRRASAATA